MPSPPTPRLLCALLLLGSLGSLPCAPAHAQHFLVRTRTLGRATQSWRIDGSVRADRPLIQGIELYGHDLTGTRTDTLSAKVALRYRTSLDRLGLAAGGDTRQLEIEGLVVDLFSVTFAPAEGAARLTLGRQWHQSALGAVEIDGAQAQGMVGSPESVALELTAFGGRHPLREGRLLAGSNLDVQALPLELEDQTTSWSAGAALRLWKDRFFSASGAYSRRQITSVPQAPGGQALGAEVLAGAMTLEPASFLLLSSTLRAHPTLGRIERAEARADAAFDLAASKLALGLALGGGRWRPVFDLSSIFNLFDPQPHDELWARAHARAFGAHALTLKAWGRRYGIDQGRGDVALGGALSYALALDLLGLPWRWDLDAVHRAWRRRHRWLAIDGRHGALCLLAPGQAHDTGPGSSACSSTATTIACARRRP